MIQVARPVEFWEFDHETSTKIVAAFLSQGAEARLRFTPSISARGVPMLDWSIPGGPHTESSHEDPGGDNSTVCPPIC
jgi:hypothetical protein